MSEKIELQVGVKVLLRLKDGKYLIIHRSEKKYPEVGDRWDIPGGRIIPGTSLLDNLKREVKEETNLQVMDEPRLIAAQDIYPKCRHVVRLTYLGEAEGEVKLDREENDEFLTLSLDELRQKEGLDGYLAKVLLLIP